MQSLSFYNSKPKVLCNVILAHYCGWMSDKLFLKTKFLLNMGKKLNLRDPQTYSEKLQWLKLYNRQPEYTMMVDKVKVKEYVSSIIGEKYVIPTLGVWKTPDEIEFDKLPDQFVLKCNHNSGTGMYICKDKSKIDVEKIKEGLLKGLKEDYYIKNREWPYKKVPRRIIAEKYINPEPSKKDLPDYKFFCFNGEVKALFVATDRNTSGKEVKFDFFDPDFNPLPFRQGHDHAEVLPLKPKHFDEMKRAAEILSKNIPHVRIDFYETEKTFLFGEFTFFHFSGMKPFEPEEWDYEFGRYLTLPH